MSKQLADLVLVKDYVTYEGGDDILGNAHIAPPPIDDEPEIKKYVLQATTGHSYTYNEETDEEIYEDKYEVNWVPYSNNNKFLHHLYMRQERLSTNGAGVDIYCDLLLSNGLQIVNYEGLPKFGTIMATGYIWKTSLTSHNAPGEVYTVYAINGTNAVFDPLNSLKSKIRVYYYVPSSDPVSKMTKGYIDVLTYSLSITDNI